MTSTSERAGRLLLVNHQTDKRRVALIESGLTTELFLERDEQRSIVGNVYKGRVVRVLPGMQSAFVEVGLARTAFLHVHDAIAPGDGEAGKPLPPINEVLQQGQELLVQIRKEPIASKGARVTTHINLPGRYVVYRPTSEQLSISRRIEDPAEKERLTGILERMKPDSGGLILRTAGEGMQEEDFQEDVEMLKALWTDIEERSRQSSTPALVFEDLDVTLRSVRDLLRSPDDRVVVDTPEETERVRSFVRRFMPNFKGAVETWAGPDPLFERFGLEWEIRRVVRRRVWLPSGGYVVIDPAEALTAIDVNSGRFVGKQSFEETAVQINLEAVREIAYHLRLRDIGGLIVIDFIDMSEQGNRDRVRDALEAALASDRVRTHLLPISELGLLEMTRKRARDTIVQGLSEPCFYCQGRGSLLSIEVLVDGVISRLRQVISRGFKGEQLTIQAHPRLIEALMEQHQSLLDELERDNEVSVQLIPSPDQHVEEFAIH
ncbi:MAG: Rne/Rng family ribonuclease [Myxococcota bacterium]|nr:Rne/Rng family ribonuclease [Myxococcota bacterium]